MTEIMMNEIMLFAERVLPISAAMTGVCGSRRVQMTPLLAGSRAAVMHRIPIYKCVSSTCDAFLQVQTSNLQATSQI